MKLLVIRLGAMGDLLHISAALRVVHHHYPDCEIHFLTAPLYRDLAGCLPHVKQVWTFDKRKPWRELWRLKQAFGSLGVDKIVNLQPSLKTMLLCRAIGVDTATYRKEKLSVQGQAQRSVSRLHAVEDFYRPFQQILELPETSPSLVPALNVPASLSIDKPAGEQWVALIPGVGGKRENRAWRVEHYRALMERLLAEMPCRLFLIGGPDERSLAEQLLAHLPEDRVENACGRQSILETAGLLARMDLVIGGDTGPLHLASSIGVPVLGIFGPTSVQRTGPRGAGQIENLVPPSKLDCWPCEQPRCPLSGERWMACMEQIPVEAVMEKARPLMTGLHSVSSEN